MRVIVKIGNIYEIRVPDGQLVYFQYIGKDKTQLYGDVIRVFKGRYKQRPSIDVIISDMVAFYQHTFVRMGVKDGSWERIGHSEDLGDMDIWFRVNKSYLKDYGPESWEIWKYNNPRKFVGVLPTDFQKADIGFLDPPSYVIQRIIDGEER